MDGGNAFARKRWSQCSATRVHRRSTSPTVRVSGGFDIAGGFASAQRGPRGGRMVRRSESQCLPIAIGGHPAPKTTRWEHQNVAEHTHSRFAIDDPARDEELR